MKNESWDDPHLDKKLETEFDNLKIQRHDADRALYYLNKLKETRIKEFHRQHSIRVGLTARKFGKFLRLDEKELLYAGTLHDVGKCCINDRLLAQADYRLNTGGHEWTDEDSRQMEMHVIHGHRMLGEEFPFTADIIVRHHSFKTENPYPKMLPESLKKYNSRDKTTIETYAKLVVIADIYDAFHRMLTPDTIITKAHIKNQMIKYSPQLYTPIHHLYSANILE